MFEQYDKMKSINFHVDAEIPITSLSRCPITIGTIVDLKAKILELKRELLVYIDCNASLQ